MSALNWLWDRAKERDTWIGLVSTAVAVGAHISPELQQSIVSLGVAVVGVIFAVTKSKGTVKNPSVVVSPLDKNV